MGILLTIAIDGPVGAGKSTVAKKLAEKLGLLYIDTGAMYRALALAAKTKEVPWTDEKGLKNLADKLKIKLLKPRGKKKDGRTVTVLVNGEDVSWKIRTPEIAEGASIISQYGLVRQILVAAQQKLANKHAVVMEGRDIGTNVLPKASLKIYMDADLDERVRRKQNQLKSGRSKVRNDILTRDKREMGRENNPLRAAKGAWILDTTDLSVEGVVALIVERVRGMGY